MDRTEPENIYFYIQDMYSISKKLRRVPIIPLKSVKNAPKNYIKRTDSGVLLKYFHISDLKLPFRNHLCHM